ncbi:hypothetical protein NN561_016283 [Cricetulus griseus]
MGAGTGPRGARRGGPWRGRCGGRWEWRGRPGRRNLGRDARAAPALGLRGARGRLVGRRGRAAWVQILFLRAEATRGLRRLRGLAVTEKRERSRPSVTAATVTIITITTITDRRPSH